MRRLSLALAAVTLLSCAAHAGEYSVSPLRVDLDRNARSGAVTLVNSGTDNIDFQISAMQWSQDGEGHDRYTPTSEIVFFPRILTLKPGESRVVRVGTQNLPASTEQAFRLFVEPIPPRTDQPAEPGARIAVNVRFALPVFLKPPKLERAGELSAPELRAGKLSFALVNTGNEHLRFEDGISLRAADKEGREILAQRVEVRYVLPGMRRAVTVPIARGACAKIATVELNAQSEGVALNRTLAVDRASCE